MATDFTEQTAADAVVESFANTPDPRLRELLTSLVRHLHAFVRDTEPTIAEWQRAIELLTATGQKCDAERQEFILLSDVLGISMLVETISNRKTAGATESTVPATASTDRSAWPPSTSSSSQLADPPPRRRLIFWPNGT
jgi:hydroxyquinol 1,2-dioxygenase